jgi:PAS domain S-box-containing protein
MDRLESRRTLDVLARSKEAVERLMAERAEQAGWGRSELLESVIDQIADAVVVVDLGGGRMLQNGAARRLAGFSDPVAGPEEWASRFGFYLPDRKTLVPPERHPLGLVLRGEEPRNVELWLKNPAMAEGQWVSVNATGLRGPGGGIRGAIFTVRDVTERKEAERMLREDEARFRALAESSFEGIVISAEARVLEVNPAFARMVGWSPEELVGRGPEALVDPAYLDLVRKRVLAGSDEPYEVLLRRKDGSAVPVEVRGRSLEYRGRSVRVTAIQDLTRRKESEEAARSALQRTLIQEGALLSLTRSPVVQGPDLGAAIREILRTCAQTLDVDRVSVWMFTEDRASLACRCLFDRDGGSFSEGATLSRDRYLPYFKALEESDLVAADEAELDPRTSCFSASYLRPQGISSMLDAPIVEEGALRGVLCHEHVGRPRRWSRDEKLYAVAAAGIVAQAIADDRRREAEAALRSSEERLRDLFDNAMDLIQSVRPDGRYEYVNRAWRDTLGYSEEEVGRLTCWEVIAPESRPHCEEIFRALMAGEPVGRIDAVFLAKDGRRVYLEGTSSVRFVEGRSVASRGIFRDVTDRRRAEASLRSSEERISDLLENASDFVSVLRADGMYEYVNRAWREKLGYTLEEALRMKWEDIVLPEQLPLLRPLWTRILAGEDVGMVELTARAKDGRRIHATGRVHAQIVDGTPVSVRGIFKDVTGERMAEEALRKSEETVVRLEEQAGARNCLERLVGKSAPMQEVYRRIRLASQSDVTVLLTGESGTGKELAAGAIHSLGARRQKRFLAVNCSAIPEALLESELFGHVKGSFTGAVRDKVGLFQAADGGTLFLDEIGDMSPTLQVKVLRALQEREVRRVGDEKAVKVDVRLIAATNRDLSALVSEQKMREDFYYRIRVFEVRMPPLRSRREDVPLLLDFFLREFSSGLKRTVRKVDGAALKRLMDHEWPGNVRELRNAVEHAFVTVHGDRIAVENLPPELRGESQRGETTKKLPAAGLRARFSDEEARERERIVEELRKAGGNRTKAAKSLGISRVTLWNRMTRYGIEA